MTRDLLIALGRMNLAILAAVLLVLILRPLAVRLFGARVRYGLWSVIPAAAAAVLAPAAHKLVHLPVSFHASFAAAPAGPATPSAGGLPWTDWLVLAWATGLVAGLVLIVSRQWAFQRDAASQGPAIVGLIRPRIHLPADFEARFSPAERDLILAHERCHLKRQDARVNGVLALAQCAFWFNPAVHLGAWLARQDQEMACDEMVLARFPTARKAYGRALLKAQIAFTGLPLGCYWPARGRLPLERRIKMLKAPIPGLGRRLAGGVAVVLLTAGCGYSAWAAQPAKIVLIAINASALPATAAAAHKSATPPFATRTSLAASTRLTAFQPADAFDDSEEPAETPAKTDADNANTSVSEAPAPVVATQAGALILADADQVQRMARSGAATSDATPSHSRVAPAPGELYLETLASGGPRWVIFRDGGRPF